MSDPFVRSDVRQFLDMLEKMPTPRMHEVDPATARAQFDAMKDLADLPVRDRAVDRALEIPGDQEPIPARLFDCRDDREPGPALVFYHGGGFVIGSVATHAGFCAELSHALDLPVISVDYRLAPEHCWPAAPDDAEAAARWIASSPDALGRNVTGLVLAGDSAGGTLTVVTAMALRDRSAAVPVIAQFPIYPAVDLQTEYRSQQLFGEGFLLTNDGMKWFGDAYRADIQHMRASPLQGEMHGLPPALVLTAGLDPLRDQGRAYAGRLIEAGVPVIFREAVGNIHGFITLRRAIPSSVGDVAGALVALRGLIREAEAQRVMAQAAE